MKTFNVFFFIILAGFSISCERDPKKPHYEFFPEMVRSVPYDAFAPNPNTGKKQTLLRPVVGTIPRGFMPYPFSADETGLQAAKVNLKNPSPNTPEILAQGKALYSNFCLICHGTGGEGDGPLIPKYPNPPSFKSKNSRKLTEGQLYHIITVGSGEMAPYASQVAPIDRWKIVRYLQVLQGKTKEELASENAPQAESQPESQPESLPMTNNEEKSDET